MSWQQVTPFNQSKASNRAGYCLYDTRLGFGIGQKYQTAIEAWQHTQQHTDQRPTGVDVPCFFTYKTEGHVAVQLANGTFWSEGTVYNNLDAYLKYHTPKYLGWGESLNDVRVLTWHPDAPAQRVIHLPADSGQWHLYNENGPYSVKAGKWKGILNPGKFGGLSYAIVADKGDGIYVIDTQNFGRGALFTNSSKFTIS